MRAQFDTIRLAAGVGCAPSPLDAGAAAGGALGEPEALSGVAGAACDGGGATILHMDVDGLSGRPLSPYETTEKIYGLYARMAGFFAARGALAFFMGGDNFMVVSADEGARENATEFLKVADSLGLGLNCGIGRGGTARQAASNATRSLDAIRKMRGGGGELERVHEAP